MLAKGVLVGDGASHIKEDSDQLSSQGSRKMSAKEKLSQEAGVVAQAVLALRSIVQQNPSEQEQVEEPSAYHEYACFKPNLRMQYFLVGHFTNWMMYELGLQ